MQPKENKSLNNTKYIFVLGGVMSGVGKGITASSIGLLLKNKGYVVSSVKIDPYLNIDAGTMNPVEHGEVYVLHDGDECDQDMGNYERFVDLKLGKDNYMTAGRVYDTVLRKERALKYGGKCVQPIPHITDEIISRIEKVGKSNQVVIIEIGGTVREYENQLFLEAARLMKIKYKNNVLTTLVSYAPNPNMIGEIKTKPTQHANRLLNESGLQADIIFVRSNIKLDKKRKEKIALFCNVEEEYIISAPDVKSIYEVPLNFEKDKLTDLIINKLNLNKNSDNKYLNVFKKINLITKKEKTIKIGLICKYVSGESVLSDAYISVIESVKHASYKLNINPEIELISSELFEGKNRKNNLEKLKDFDAIVIPGGFGNRGVEGKINAIKYTRENNIPTLGICYGMQLMVIEYARNVLNIKNATSGEINNKSKNKIVDIIESQKDNIKNDNMGNTMRLGDCESVLNKDTDIYKLYKKLDLVDNNHTITERHRHRYEVNPKYYNILNNSELKISGISKNEGLAESVELDNHKYFIGVQYHPEFTSKPDKPNPVFYGLIKAIF